MDMSTSFIWIIILFDEAFKYGDDAEIFEVIFGKALNSV
jgi:hypothetical protein